jgi:hypothetical protein
MISTYLYFSVCYLNLPLRCDEYVFYLLLQCLIKRITGLQSAGLYSKSSWSVGCIVNRTELCGCVLWSDANIPQTAESNISSFHEIRIRYRIVIILHKACGMCYTVNKLVQGQVFLSVLQHFSVINIPRMLNSPDDVIGILLWHDPSGRTMALGLLSL